MRSFSDAINERVLVCDGAMGTMLYAEGVFVNRSFDALNVSDPDLVEQIHRAYRTPERMCSRPIHSAPIGPG